MGKSTRGAERGREPTDTELERYLEAARIYDNKRSSRKRREEALSDLVDLAFHAKDDVMRGRVAAYLKMTAGIRIVSAEEAEADTTALERSRCQRCRREGHARRKAMGNVGMSAAA